MTNYTMNDVIAALQMVTNKVDALEENTIKLEENTIKLEEKTAKLQGDYKELTQQVNYLESEFKERRKELDNLNGRLGRLETRMLNYVRRVTKDVTLTLENGKDALADKLTKAMRSAFPVKVSNKVVNKVHKTCKTFFTNVGSFLGSKSKGVHNSFFKGEKLAYLESVQKDINSSLTTPSYPKSFSDLKQNKAITQ